MLPTELLHLIATYLDNKSVLTCRSVCPRWKAIIDLNVLLPLSITEENFSKVFCPTYEGQFKINRVTALTIIGRAARCPRIPTAIPFNPVHLKIVNFEGTTKINPGNFALLLAHCSRIETLSIRYARSRDTPSNNLSTLQELVHPGLRTLNFFNVLLHQTKNPIALLGILSAPNLIRFSILGNPDQKAEEERDDTAWRNSVLAFARRHRATLKEVNAHLKDDEFNRNLVREEIQNGLAIRILDICADSWRPLTTEFAGTLTRVEFSLSIVHDWSTVMTILAPTRHTLTAVSISCDGLWVVNLKFFQKFYRLKELSITCFRRTRLNFVSNLPPQLEEIHFCLFPLREKNWDDLLGPKFANLNGLEVGIFQDQSDRVNFRTKHYEMIKNHQGLNEVLIHGRTHSANWNRIERKLQASPQVQTLIQATKTRRSVHLQLN